MKIKCEIIPKLNNLTNVEWKVFQYIVSCMNQTTGRTKGVFYRDVMEHTGCCKQSFYNALKGMSEKGVITYTKNSEVDYDVTITDNYFPGDREREKGYISLSRDVFYSDDYKQLKAHEKYMLLYLMKCTYEGGSQYHKKKTDFLEDFAQLLNVTTRVIKGYLHSMKQFFYINVRAGILYVKYRPKVFGKLQQGNPEYRTEEMHEYESVIRTECHRNHINYDAAQITDTANLIRQHRKKLAMESGEKKTSGSKEVLNVILESIRDSVKGIQRKDRELSPSYIHKKLLAGIERILDTRKQQSDPEPVPETGKQKAASRFHNFPQRSYDYDELEAQLLGRAFT